ncbi:hypothetical protein BROOK1789C_1526 [Bathymodiolus brooksi thiotrophic gill symbiont]|nr:hypothetical protein BROOK1789C_1526 [Bathymodiolus brooksi thiotrophic gill symbiont]
MLVKCGNCNNTLFILLTASSACICTRNAALTYFPTSKANRHYHTYINCANSERLH